LNGIFYTHHISAYNVYNNKNDLKDILCENVYIHEKAARWKTLKTRF